MASLNNENLIKLIFANFTFHHAKSLISNVNNKSINHALFSILTYDSLYSSIGKVKTNLTDYNGTIIYFTKFDNDSFLVEATMDTSLWNMNNLQRIKTIKVAPLTIRSAIKLPNGHSAYTTSQDLTILNEDFNHIGRYEIWDFNILLLLSNETMALTNNGKPNPEILIFDYNNNYKIIENITNAHSDYILYLINLNRNRFASSSEHLIKIWTCDGFTCLKTLNENQKILCLAFVDKYDLLLSGDVGKIINVFDMTNYDCVKKIEAHSAAINCLLSLPGGYFVSGSDDNTIKIWDLNGFRCVNMLKYVKSNYTFLVLLKDYRLVCASSDITVWSS
jgi:WD40 repeat protein